MAARCCPGRVRCRPGAADGRTFVVLRPVPAPPGHVPVSLPGSKPGKKSATIFDVAFHLAANPRRRERFLAAQTPSGAVRFIIERRPAGANHPETWPLTAEGQARGVVRRLDGSPARVQFLRADGQRVGSLKHDPQSPKPADRYLVRDRSGRHVATVGPGTFRRWARHIEPGTDPLLRDLVPALLADAGRFALS